MNKQQLIEKIATEAACTKAQAETIMNCAFENIKKAVKKGDDVNLEVDMLARYAARLAERR